MSGQSAPGAPGSEPRWTTSRKSGVGTAFSSGSRLWFTVSHGVLNEIYYPRTDLANTRDAEFIVTGKGFFSEEKRDTQSDFEQLDPWAPAYRLTNTCLRGNYRIVKELVSDPERSAILQRVAFHPLIGLATDYSIYYLVSPHILNHGRDNSARVADHEGIPMLFATRSGIHMAVACDTGFLVRSVGFVGTSDGWHELVHNGRITDSYTNADHGNVALTAQVALPASGTFTVAMAFAATPGEAAQQARAALLKGFDQSLAQYVQTWHNATRGVRLLHEQSNDGGRLFRASAITLLTHMDKSVPGATVASLSIPWGDIKGDGDLGGYHLVWARDLVESATARLAIGDAERAWQAFLYLASIQREDGSWPQNNWLDGEPYWPGVQLDETAFPIILAWRLQGEAAARGFSLWPIVRKAASFLARSGPVTPEERWEEDGGYSPSTLAACIAALVCAADFARQAGELNDALYLEWVADWWASKIDDWTFTTTGSLLPGHTEYFERLGVPVFPMDGSGVEAPEFVPIRNLPSNEQQSYPAKDVIDTGFLELVRYGVRRADDPRIVSSLAVVDALLRVELPCGPCWHRYNHDGYGERSDGYPFDGAGVGRVWPLLTGERGHYELAAGNINEARRLLHAMECFANEGGLLPEQLWDNPNIPERELEFGRPSGSAMPLVWAHAEYLKLLRSITDGKVFDVLAPVVQRYATGVPPARTVWRFNHKTTTMPLGEPLRIEVNAAALMRWTTDGWATHTDTTATYSGLESWYIDMPAAVGNRPCTVEFTFYWLDAEHWEGTNFLVVVGA